MVGKSGFRYQAAEFCKLCSTRRGVFSEVQNAWSTFSALRKAWIVEQKVLYISKRKDAQHDEGTWTELFGQSLAL
jgi:hypothetical protein